MDRVRATTQRVERSLHRSGRRGTAGLARTVVELLPPRWGLVLRAQKNRANLHGLHAPAHVLTDLVAPGCVALDIGANRGLYTYWIARNARQVHAFEPNPSVFAYLSAAAAAKVTAHNVALSDSEGTVALTIPRAGDGEASIAPRAAADVVTSIVVAKHTLDSFDLAGVGFVKIDVEGHELDVLRGGRRTLEAQRPIVFIEAEERHHPGAVQAVSDFFLETLGYRYGYFMLSGKLRPLAEFDVDVHQPVTGMSNASPDYVSNFLFRP